jgi:hypothetical protein
VERSDQVILIEARPAEQQTCSYSMVLPESELKNYKEGDTLEVILKPAGSP